MKDTLLHHAARYPRWLPQDAVKLCYQSEWGCGHLIQDEAACAAWIAREKTECDIWSDEPASETIGGGLRRYTLHSPLLRALPEEWLAAMMAHTAAGNAGTAEGLAKRLAEADELAKDGRLGFAADAWAAYVRDYADAGYPMARHSERYREMYAPAYRVADARYAPLLPLLLAVRQRLACEGSVLLVLDGPCAGGKSTAAALLEACTGATVFHMDDFFLPPEKRTAERLAQPGGNVDYERFLAEVLDKLPLQKALGYRAWDCHAQRLEPRIAPPGRLTIIEGAYALHPAFAARYGALDPITALVDVEPAVQLLRLERRGPELLPRFQNEWIPLEKAYFEAYHIGERVRFRLRMGEGEP